MIHVENLEKSYDSNIAVNNVSFEVKEGEIFGLLGPNGAGKSTIINILVTILKSDNGRASINGFDVVKDQNNVRKSIGIIFQDPSLDQRLTAWENMYFHSKLYHVPSEEIESRITRSLELVGLLERKKDLVASYSGGMKRRLVIVRSLLNCPRLLILDEPTTGLDPQVRHLIWNKLRQLKKEGTTILLTTHYMEEAFQICDRIIIMDKGKKILEGNSRNLLKENIEGNVMEIPILEGAEDGIEAKIKSKGFRFEKHKETIFIYSDNHEKLKLFGSANAGSMFTLCSSGVVI